MPRLRPDQVPAYRLHKQSGQAVVTLCARDFTLGLYGTPDSRRRYHELIARWEANNRQPIHLAPEELRPASIAAPLTIRELCELFHRHAATHYRRPDGTATSEPSNYRLCLGILCDAFGDTPAAEFATSKLREVQARMIKRGWVRKSIIVHVRRVRHVFKWAVNHELVPANVHAALTAFEPLKRGRSAARESDPVKPVPVEYVHAIRDHVSPQVWALVELQLLTGCRPGELLKMRPCDIDRGGPVWLYRPTWHKTAQHGHERTIAFGPRAQAVLAGR